MGNFATIPVNHFVRDDFVTPAADWHVPPAEWDGWEARYDGDGERGKRTTRRLSDWAEAVAELMTAPAVLAECAGLCGEEVSPDPDRWGGGLQVTAPGGFLGPHLDGVLHPRWLDRRRSVTLVLFCHPRWESGWGGDFYLAGPDGEPAVLFDPRPGRLLAFESGDDRAIHGVLPVTGPAERVTITLSLLATRRPGDYHTRSRFLPVRPRRD